MTKILTMIEIIRVKDSNYDYCSNEYKIITEFINKLIKKKSEINEYKDT